MKNRSGFGWIQLIIGVLMIVLGVYAFVSPDNTLTGFVIIYGVIAIIIGICDIIFYVEAARFTGFGPVVAMVSGILSVMAGIMLVVYPGAGKLVMSLIFPIWFIAHCISILANLHVVRIGAGSFCYWFSLVTCILGLIMGLLMLFEPMVSIFTASFMIGLYLIVLGVDSIVLAFSDIGSRR